MKLLKALLCAVFVGVAAFINTDTDDGARLYIDKLFPGQTIAPCLWNPDMVGIILYADTNCATPYFIYSFYVGPSDQIYYYSDHSYEYPSWWEDGPSYGWRRHVHWRATYFRLRTAGGMD